MRTAARRKDGCGLLLRSTQSLVKPSLSTLLLPLRFHRFIEFHCWKPSEKNPRRITEGFLCDEVGLDNDEVNRFMKRASGILRLSESMLQSRIGFFRDTFKFSDAALKKLVTGCMGEILHIHGDENVVERAKYLVKVFDGDHETVGSIITRFPSILQGSVKNNLKPKVDFFLSEIFLGDQARLLSQIKQHPQVLFGHFSLAGRIRPRLKAIAEAGMDPSACLESIVLSNRRFARWLDVCVQQPDDGKDEECKSATVNAVWLENEIGLTKREAERFVQTHLGLTKVSQSNVSSTISFFQNTFELSQNELKRLLTIGLASVLHLDGEESAVEKTRFLIEYFGGDKQFVHSIICGFPRLLCQPFRDDLKCKLLYFMNEIFQGDEASLHKELLRCPDVLVNFSLPDHIVPRVNALRNAGIEPSAHIFTLCLNEQKFAAWLQAPKATLVERPVLKQYLSMPRWQEACRGVDGLTFADSLCERHYQTIALKSPPVWVDSVKLLELLEERGMASSQIMAVDSEFSCWRQSSIFQLAFVQQGPDRPFLDSFVIDLMVDDDQYLRTCRETMERMFQSKFVLGFAVHNDLKGLDDKVGTCLLSHPNVLDLQDFWEAPKPSLAACVEHYCTAGARLRKDGRELLRWDQRPLEPDQLEYAALDAAVLLVLLAEMAREEG